MKLLSPLLAFALKFVLVFAILMGLFEASRGSAVERFLVEDCILRPTVGLIRTLAPHEQVELMGRAIVSPASKLRVTRGCEGVEIFLILVAGVVAFPASAAARLRGLAVGAVLAYLLSVARLVALHFTLRYTPDAWEVLHGLVLPLGPLIVISLYFMSWSARVPMKRAPHAS